MESGFCFLGLELLWNLLKSDESHELYTDFDYQNT